MGIIEDLQKLKDKLLENPADREIVEEWEKEAKRAIVVNNLAEHDGMKPLIVRIKERISDINRILLEMEHLTEGERNLLWRDRTVFEWLLNFFEISRSIIKSTKKRVKDEIDDDLLL